MRAIKQFFTGAWSLVAGLSVTLRYLFKHRATVQYPFETLEMSPAYRGRIQLRYDEEAGGHVCVACMQCEEICPSNCLTIEGEKDPETRKKYPTRFDLRYELCSLCGLCVDVCPTVALEYSTHYEDLSTQRSDLVFDLLAPFAEGSSRSEAPEDDEEEEIGEGEEVDRQASSAG